MANPNSFDSKSSLSVGGTDYTLYRIDKVAGHERKRFAVTALALAQSLDGFRIGGVTSEVKSAETANR